MSFGKYRKSNLPPRENRALSALGWRAPATRERKRVLFLCVGNAIRSQMAEAFARKYGDELAEFASAGLSPAQMLAPSMRAVMEERNVSLDTHFPKGIDALPYRDWDLVVNISGYPLPPSLKNCPSIDWMVEDPLGQKQDAYAVARDIIEQLVMRLILEMRRPNP